MANQQTSSNTHTGTQQHGSAQGNVAQGRSTTQQGVSGTGVRDATYNLISVVYHALQGAETYKMYEEDVERTQDDELASFFRQCHEDEKRRAQRGKELLVRHLQSSQGSGQQLQSGTSSQQQRSVTSSSASQQGGSARNSQQSGGSSNQQTQAVPGDQYGNTQSTSAGKSGPDRGSGSR